LTGLGIALPFFFAATVGTPARMHARVHVHIHIEH